MKTKDDTASAATSHLIQLQGVRMGLADELDDGKIINAATIKEQTGGGSISARELFKKMKNFIPTHKLALLTNNKPRTPMEEVNQGLLRRIVLEVYPKSVRRGLRIQSRYCNPSKGGRWYEVVSRIEGGYRRRY
jgi:phage/plasmid-associated DNA primase